MKPVSVGNVPKTSAPLPVSSVIRLASSRDVSMDVLDTLLLKLVQLAEVRQPNVEALAVSQVMLLTALVSPVEKVNGFS